ncbi:MAG: transporter substrate-binding domain-containing protein [Rhodospirillaceae bacterium]|nr:transporter substrate-binding domain-containing protein [Rhodospirillaceae bacterium]MBT7136314.1 transporter substrate-binding domain-containing protein [Rhodospirillaceae bacterium]
MTLLSGKLVSPKRALGLLSLIAMLFGLSPLATAQEATDAPAPLRIAIDRAYSPYSLIGPTGEATGLAVEMWRAWSEATGTPVEFVASGWEETLEALRTGKVDAHFGMFKYASRAEWADFAEPIHQIHTALFFRAGEDEMVPLKDLAGEKVGVWAETYQHQFLKDNFPDIKAVASKSDDQLILKLLNGDVRAILNEVPSVDADLASFGIRGVLTRSEKILFSNYVQPAVRKGETALLELINEGFRKVSIDRLHELEKLWMSSPSDHFYAGAGGQVEFTLEEEAWLDANPAITLAVTTFIQPVDVIDEAGNYSGMNADLINMLNQKLGINIVPEFFDSWGKVVKATTGGTVDGAFSLSITPEREKSVLFTKPYAFDPIIAIVPRTSNDILDWKDLNGKNVSVVKGASIIEEIQGMLGDGALITVESEADGLKQVESGAADIHVSWLLPYGNAQRSDPVDGLKIALTRNSEGGSLRIGIHKDRPELLGILRKGLNAISREELTAVRNKWLFPKDASMDMPVTLRADELGWMQAHPIIRLAVLKDYAPFDFTNNDGTHSGLHSDLLKLINKHLGANIVAIPFDTWKEAYDKAASGDLDGIMSLGWTKEREKTFLFSTPYHYDPADMVVQDIDGSVKSWRALNGKTIWVRNSSSLIRKIKKDLPDANIIEADSEAYALEQLASGNGDAYLAWISADKSKLRSMGLKVAASVDTRQGELLIGVHRSRPLVAGIIQKGLGSISAKEMAALRSKWLFSEQQMADLTAEEWAWVENRTIKVGVEQWAPLVFLDNSGNLQGLAGGFLRRVSNATGLKFEIVGDEWASLLGDFKERKIDLLPATYFTEERATYGLYSDPFFYMREYVYVKDGSTDISSIKDIADKRIAVVKGYGTIPKIRAKYPKATIVETNNLMTSIDAVLNSEVDALIEAQMVVEHTIKTNAIIGLKGISQSVFPASPLHFFSRIDEPILQSILQKGLDAITEEEERAEIGKWISATKTERQKLGLSIDEQGWLSEHENIRLGVDTSWPPFEFVDEDGKYSGVSSGYIDVISKRLELSMQAVPGINWSQAIEKIKFGELDVLPAVARTPEREAFLNFTKPYVKVPMVIATHKDGPVVGEVGDLEGKSVGVVTGYASAELLRADFPKLNFIEMNSVAALLLALSEGKIDTAFENLWVISYEKERLSLDDVKIAVPTSYNIDLSMGVRKDWPELVPILDKALASIDKQQSTTIRNAWMAVEVKFGLDMKTVLIWAVPAGGGVLLIIAFVVGWNRRLGAEIDERKRAEEELAKRTNLIQAVLGSLTQGIVAFDKDLKLIAWNNHYKEIRDYPSELLEEGRDFRDNSSNFSNATLILHSLFIFRFALLVVEPVLG